MPSLSPEEMSAMIQTTGLSAADQLLRMNKEDMEVEPKPVPSSKSEPTVLFGPESEAYYWILRCSSKSLAYKTTMDERDLLTLDNNKDNLKLAEVMAVVFDMRIDEKNATITLHRTPAGHKIRSLLNAKS